MVPKGPSHSIQDVSDEVIPSILKLAELHFLKA
jgi:hypothetical protein